MKKYITEKNLKVLKSYVRAIGAVVVYAALEYFTNLKPEFAIAIAAVFGPLVKWADKNEKEFGRGSK